ncbi:MAG: proliferating cell nuclear antigen (pcna) [Colwellia sp.]|nr:proliferating cell nuclear antigen (pcna) [Colwellia sp.]
MLEARVHSPDIFKKLIRAVGDLIENVNFDCCDEGIRLQAMDSSHVSLVNVFLSTESFSYFKCETNHTLGINLDSLNKVLKCSKPRDSITLRHKNESDTLQIILSNES